MTKKGALHLAVKRSFLYTTTKINQFLFARLRSVSSRITLRIRIDLGVTSTYSSSLMYSNASSKENCTGGIRRAFSSEPEARILVSFLDLVTFTTRSLS